MDSEKEQFKIWLEEVRNDQEEQRQKDLQLDEQTKLLNQVSFYMRNNSNFSMNLEMFLRNYDNLGIEEYENCLQNWLGVVWSEQEKQRQKDLELDEQTKLSNRVSFYLRNDSVFSMNLETFVRNYEKDLKLKK
jgi:uncharacterized protein YozE (UPF0346 family)